MMTFGALLKFHDFILPLLLQQNPQFLCVKFITDFRTMVMAHSGHQFGLCRQFTYRTIFPPTMDKQKGSTKYQNSIYVSTAHISKMTGWISWESQSSSTTTLTMTQPKPHPSLQTMLSIQCLPLYWVMSKICNDRFPHSPDMAPKCRLGLSM